MSHPSYLTRRQQPTSGDDGTSYVQSNFDYFSIVVQIPDVADAVVGMTTIKRSKLVNIAIVAAVDVDCVYVDLILTDFADGVGSDGGDDDDDDNDVVPMSDDVGR